MLSPSNKILLPFALAFAWHSVDATLHLTRSPRRARSIWVGVGLGWSAFWLIKHFTEPPIMVISNPDLEKDYAIIEI
jgi:hypothetical protein